MLDGFEAAHADAVRRETPREALTSLLDERVRLIAGAADWRKRWDAARISDGCAAELTMSGMQPLDEAAAELLYGVAAPSLSGGLERPERRS